MGALLEDLRFACRGLRRASAFSAAALLTLTLSLAGTATMFALIRGVLLRPLPVADQDRLIVAWKELRSGGFSHHPFGGDAIKAMSGSNRLFERVAGVDANGAGRSVIAEHGGAGYVRAAVVTGSFFDVLGVHPVAGRLLREMDDVEGAELVLVISHGLWQRRYGGSPDVAGRRVVLDDRPFTIVGVAPPGLDYPVGVEGWRTTHSFETTGPFGDAARQEIDLVARLRRGVTVEQAADELARLTRQFESTSTARTTRGLTPVVKTFETAIVGDVQPALVALLTAVGLVLLIGTANAANLSLLRAEARRTELAVREALGAPRARMVWLVTVETLLIMLAAAAAGLALAWWGLRALLAILPDGLPRMDVVEVDARVIAFTLSVALVSALVVGLGPALLTLESDSTRHLRAGGQRTTRAGARLGRRALVVAQVALAVTVVAGAAVLTRTVLNLQSLDTGFPGDRLVFLELVLPEASYSESARHARFLDDLVSRLQAAPAIAGATPVNVPPFSADGGWDVPRFTAEGQDAKRAAANPSLNLESIHPNYFETLQVPIVRGRAFTEADRRGAVAVAIVSEDAAARTWPHEDPVGRRLKMGGPESTDQWRVVVGVAGETRYRELSRPRPTIYLPAYQFQMTAQMLVLRTAASIDLVASLAREQVHAVDPDVRVMRIATFHEIVARPLARPRFNATILAIFGIASLLLATTGIHAVMGAYVRYRELEIRIRVALGATAAHVRRLVIGEILRLAVAGTGLGLAISAASGRYLRGLVFDVAPFDATSTTAAVVLLLTAALLATYTPMRRAISLDPAGMLRAE
ncbi:MAG TPA: ADOP family duplicated permease [Vicinamibacterales bacterium]|nr:ADOP family duplicated permease [Vicinamibacterales bacterium]